MKEQVKYCIQQLEFVHGDLTRMQENELANRLKSVIDDLNRKAENADALSKAIWKQHMERFNKINELALKKDRAGLEAMGIFLPETFYQG